MNLFDSTLISLGRALLIASLATGIALYLRRGLAAQRSRLLWLAAVTFLIPGMLAGYSFSSLVRSWITSPWRAEAAYMSFILLRLLPLALIAITLAPAPLSREAIHCFRLLPGKSRWQRLLWRMKAGDTGLFLTVALVFLFAFQEFDIATSWGVCSWTVSLFDAHVGGLDLSHSLRLASFPLAVEIGALGVLLWLLQNVRMDTQESSPAAGGNAAAGIVIGVCFVVTTLLPLVALLRLAWPGFHALQESFSLSREIANSLALAVVVTLIVFSIAAGLRSRLARAALAILGLLGSFLIALLILAAIQLPWIRTLSSTPLPLIAGLCFQLLPLAIGLLVIVRSGTLREALHAARLGGSRALLWRLQSAPLFAIGLLLFGTAYGDFVMNAVLAPPQFTGAFNRIFNLMHYGQSVVLSAMVTVTLLAPLAVASLVFCLLRFTFKNDVRPH